MFRFNELLELWRKDNHLVQAYNDSEIMLENTEAMYRESVQSLRYTDNNKNVTQEIREKDVMINKYEREVRRKVLQHLAITGGVNIIPGLILTSIVIDLERIGDYTKNIADMAKIHPKKLVCGIYDADITKIEKAVNKMFEDLLPIIKSSSKKRARKLVMDNIWALKLSDEIVTRVVQEEDRALSSGDAAAAALYTRYLKRIAAHLINVATSIVNPFENIGFRVEGDDE